jgi:hypothetical protein
MHEAGKKDGQWHFLARRCYKWEKIFLQGLGLGGVQLIVLPIYTCTTGWAQSSCAPQEGVR